MKTSAAIATAPGEPWTIRELDISDPREGEVLVRWEFGGLCLSDEHGRQGRWDTRFPYVGGHEGSGIVEDVGPGVSRLRAGDHVAACWIPVCGRCRWCSTGHTAMCVDGPSSSTGLFSDGGARFHDNGVEVASFAGLGTFARRAVVADGSCVRIDPSVPLDIAALASCAVLTGWGAAVRAGETAPGESVAIIGVGGVGLNAVLGAVQAGAAVVIAIDPNPVKRSVALELGATHAFATADEAKATSAAANPSAGGVDLSIVAAGSLSSEVVAAAFAVAGRRGRVVIASMADGPVDIVLPGMDLVGDEKRVIGTSYGSCNPHSDIPLVLRMAQAGTLPLQRFISDLYSLDDIEAGYSFLHDGRNIRGLIDHQG